LTTALDITPNPLYFVRNHGGIPLIDEDKFELTLDGLVKEPKKFSLADLQDESKFPQMEEIVTIQCSGTRRIEQIGLYAGEGDEMINAPWAEGVYFTSESHQLRRLLILRRCHWYSKVQRCQSQESYQGLWRLGRRRETPGVLRYVVTKTWSSPLC
jgi:sulfite oxidase